MDNKKLNETELKEKEVEEARGGYDIARCVYKDDGSLKKCPSPNRGSFDQCDFCHLFKL